ncbi:MAG: zinc-ribbon domain-containing protein [Firmicutes bacterium]|nr:zinc-ribbon domain-containing protein [Candidatus Colimorpha enterica]
MFCKNCGTQINEGTTFCPNCGQNLAEPVAPVAIPDPYDHTAEFTEDEVKEYKTFALITYFLGFIGIIIALLAVHEDSKYINFHVRQSIKATIVSMIVCLLFIIPVIGWILAPLALIALAVFVIIGIVWTCQGKSKELILIRLFTFLG